MSKDKTIEKVRELGLLAVLRGPSPEITIQMVNALVEGGVLGIEITFTTPRALEVVKDLKDYYADEILLGMGTLMYPEHVEGAIRAGAQFIVSPHYDKTLAQAMVASGLGVMMGALTPSEVFSSYAAGSDIVKVFPGSAGGPGYMKALKGPFPEIPMMPTGGVTVDNLVEWFQAGAAAVGAGSNLCPKQWAMEGRFAEIKSNAVEFVSSVHKARSLAQ
jgi:2-dehydro-3-deoxyphosphogluconate aldolase/(4S)-4-hydroxy-2-oxoglutarate aldolase